MSRAVVGAALCMWVGSFLLLGQWRRLARPSLADRLRPYRAGGDVAGGDQPHLGGTIVALLGPSARRAGDRLAVLFGVRETAAARLQRIHSPLDVTAFRLRQFAWSALAALAALILAAGGAPLSFVVLAVAGGPALAFLVVEQRLAAASARWKERVRYELPVVSEQVAMLLNAGYSLGATINRVASRGRGACARDLQVVANRIRQGLSERRALQEWADRVDVEAVHRLVGILAMQGSTGELGRLVGSEARQARRDLHRRLVTVMERREQQVWIPVTVATLVPGAIFLAIPFVAALSLFAHA